MFKLKKLLIPIFILLIIVIGIVLFFVFKKKKCVAVDYNKDLKDSLSKCGESSQPENCDKCVGKSFNSVTECIQNDPNDSCSEEFKSVCDCLKNDCKLENCDQNMKDWVNCGCIKPTGFI
jgi:hypothetical protein